MLQVLKSKDDKATVTGRTLGRNLLVPIDTIEIAFQKSCGKSGLGLCFRNTDVLTEAALLSVLHMLEIASQVMIQFDMLCAEANRLLLWECWA